MPWSIRWKCYGRVDFMQQKVTAASSSCLITSAWPPPDSVLIIISSPQQDSSISANIYKYIGLSAVYQLEYTRSYFMYRSSLSESWATMGMKSTGFLIHFNFSFPPQAVYWHAIVMLVGLGFFCWYHYCFVVVCFELGFLNPLLCCPICFTSWLTGHLIMRADLNPLSSEHSKKQNVSQSWGILFIVILFFFSWKITILH